MKRDQYPAEWEAIAQEVKEAADWRCVHCGRQCYRPGEKVETRKRVLTVAHWPDSDPMNVAKENLLALCAPCHLRLDASMHARRAAGTRRLKRAKLGQLGFAVLEQGDGDV